MANAAEFAAVDGVDAGWGARYCAMVVTGIITKARREAAQGGRAQLNF